MADEIIGGVAIGVTADFSALDAAFDAAVQKAVADGQSLADAISSAMKTPDVSGVTGAVDQIDEKWQQLGRDMAAALGVTLPAPDVSAVTSALDQVDHSAGQARDALGRFTSSTGDAGSAAHSAASGVSDLGNAGAATSTAFEGMVGALAAVAAAVSIAAIKNFAEDVAGIADNATRAQISLTALTGSAQAAGDMIERLDQLAIQDGLAMPQLQQAAQTLTAMLPVGTDVVGVLSQLADSAAVSGANIDTLAGKLAGIVDKGTLSVKALKDFGISLDDVKQAMIDTGAGADKLSEGVTKAFASLSENDRLVVVQTALLKLKGIAEDVAQNTFGGIWHSATAEWDTDIKIIQDDLGKLAIQSLGAGLKTAVNDIAVAFVSAGTLIKISVDEIKGQIDALSIAATALGKTTKDALTGNFAAVASDTAAAFQKIAASEKTTQDQINSDLAAGVKISADILNQVSTHVDAVIPHLNNLGQSGKDAADKIAAAVTQINGFIAQVDAGGTVSQLQKDFENAGKAIDAVAKVNLPDAILAVQKYTDAQIANGASATVMQAAIAKESQLYQQMAKTDLPDATSGLLGMAETMATTGQKIGTVTSAFNEFEKIAQAYAKTDAQAVVAAQSELIQVFIDTNQPLSLLDQAFGAQSKTLQSLAKTDIQGAVDGYKELIGQEQAAGAPTQQLVKTFQDEQKVFQDLAKTDLQGAADGLGKLAQQEKDANAPAQVVTDTLKAQQAVLMSMGTTDVEGAVAGLAKLAQQEIALNEPAQVVTATFDAERQEILKMASSEGVDAAITALNNLAAAQIASKQPATDITATFDAEAKILTDLGKTNIQAAIDGLGKLATQEAIMGQPVQEITKAFHDQEAAIKQLAPADQVAQLAQLAYNEQAMLQPAQDVTRALQDEQTAINAMATHGLPAAIQAQKDFIQQLVNMHQPAEDVKAAMDDLNKLYQQMAQTNLPAFVDELGKAAAKLTDQNASATQIATSMANYEKGIQSLATVSLPAAISAQQNYISLLERQNATQGQILAAQGQLDQMVIKLGDDTGNYAGDAVFDLEKVRLKQEDLRLSSHGYADDMVKGIQDILKGFDQLGTAMADAIVNGTNLGKALIDTFKKIAASVLSDLINAALVPLKQALIEMIGSLIPGFGSAATTILTGINAIGPASAAASSGLTALGTAATAAATAITSAGSTLAAANAAQATSAASVTAAQTGEAAAMAAEVGADTADVAATTADTAATTADTASKVADTTAAAGEAAAMAAEAGVTAADAAATTGDTAAKIADTTAGVADTAASVADAAAKTADTVTTAADAVAKGAEAAADIAETVATIADTVAQIAFASAVGAVAAVIGAIAGIVGDIYMAAIDTKLFHIETSLLAIQNDTANRRKDAWDQFNQTYSRIGEMLDRLNHIMDGVSAIVAAGGISVGNAPQVASDLDSIAGNIATLIDVERGIVGHFDTIDRDFNAGLQNVASILGNIYSILTRIAANSDTSQSLSQSMSESMSTMSDRMATGTQALSDTIERTGGNTDGRNVVNTNTIHTDFTNAINTANAQLAAAKSANDEMNALSAEYQAAQTAMNQALAIGDTALAQQYQRQMQEIMGQIASFQEQQSRFDTSQGGVQDQQLQALNDQYALLQQQLTAAQLTLAADTKAGANSDKLVADSALISDIQLKMQSVQNQIQQETATTVDYTKELAGASSISASNSSTLLDVVSTGTGNIVSAVNASATTIAQAIAGTGQPNKTGAGAAPGQTTTQTYVPGSRNVNSTGGATANYPDASAGTSLPTAQSYAAGAPPPTSDRFAPPAPPSTPEQHAVPPGTYPDGKGGYTGVPDTSGGNPVYTAPPTYTPPAAPTLPAVPVNSPIGGNSTGGSTSTSSGGGGGAGPNPMAPLALGPPTPDAVYTAMAQAVHDGVQGALEAGGNTLPSGEGIYTPDTTSYKPTPGGMPETVPYGYQGGPAQSEVGPPPPPPVDPVKAAQDAAAATGKALSDQMHTLYDEIQTATKNGGVVQAQELQNQYDALKAKLLAMTPEYGPKTYNGLVPNTDSTNTDSTGAKDSTGGPKPLGIPVPPSDKSSGTGPKPLGIPVPPPTEGSYTPPPAKTGGISADQQAALTAAMDWLNAQQGISDADKAISAKTFADDASAGDLPVAVHANTAAVQQQTQALQSGPRALGIPSIDTQHTNTPPTTTSSTPASTDISSSTPASSGTPPPAIDLSSVTTALATLAVKIDATNTALGQLDKDLALVDSDAKASTTQELDAMQTESGQLLSALNSGLQNLQNSVSTAGTSVTNAIISTAAFEGQLLSGLLLSYPAKGAGQGPTPDVAIGGSGGGGIGPMPSFDVGGLAPDDMIAMIHRGEAVLPPDLTAMLRRAASQPAMDSAIQRIGANIVVNAPITINGAQDGQTMAKTIVRHLKLVVPQGGLTS